MKNPFPSLALIVSPSRYLYFSFLFTCLLYYSGYNDVFVVFGIPTVFNLICNKGWYKKKIWKRTRNTTVPVLFVSVVYSNFSAQTSNWIHNNRKRKVLCIYRQPSSLNTICNKGGYTKEIRKGTTNTMVPVLFVSVVYLNFSTQTTDSNEKRL